MVKIRIANLIDMQRVIDIYNYYVTNSVATFDTDLRTIKEQEKIFSKYSSIGPYQMFVAEENNFVLGFASTDPYREHTSFQKTIAVTVYVDHNYRKNGIGSKLYEELFKRLEEEPSWHTALAGIALPNEASIVLHKKFGFTEVGIFKEYGYKNNQYISSIWLQKNAIF